MQQDSNSIAARAGAEGRSAPPDGVNAWLQSHRLSARLSQRMDAAYDAVKPYDEDEDDKHKFTNRMIVCAVAVTLLWITSLRVCVDIVSNSIAAPSTSEIYAYCDDAYQVTQEEEEKYDMCTTGQIRLCGSSLDTLIEQERSLSESALQDNDVIIASLSSQAATCDAATQSTRNALNTWLAISGHTVTYLGTGAGCDNTTLQRTTNFLSDTSVAAAGATAIIDNNVATSKSTVSDMAAYADARTAYDAAYLANETDHITSEMNAAVNDVADATYRTLNDTMDDMNDAFEKVKLCSSVNGQDDGICSGPSAAAVYNASLEAVKKNVAQASASLQANNAGLTAWVSDAGALTAKMFDFASGLASIQNDPYFSSISWGNTFGNAFPSNLQPSLSSVSAANIQVPTADLGSIAASVASVVTDAGAALAAAGADVVNVGENWRADLASGLPDASALTTDYDPPVMNSYVSGSNSGAEASASHDAEVDAYQAESATGVDGVAAQATSGDDDDNAPKSKLNINVTDAGQYLSNPSFSYEDLSSTQYSVDTWLNGIAALGQAIIIMDIVYRVFLTLYEVYRFWNRSGLKIKPADLRKDRSDYRFLEMSPWKMSLAVITSPILYALFFAVIIFVGISLLAAAYVPVYNEYVDGCVKGSTNGTFVTENLYALAYNYASDDGNTNVYEGLEDYNVRLVDSCNTYGTSSANQYNNQQTYFDAEVGLQGINKPYFDDMETCVDATDMDTQFTAACCDQSPYPACAGAPPPPTECPYDAAGQPYSTVSSLMAGSPCNDDFSGYSLDASAVFDCDTLPGCDTTCAGPDKELLRSVTKQCGCLGENMFHAWWFQMTLALIVFISLNVARTFFVKGVIFMSWRSLTPNLFDYIATIRRSGKFVPPARLEGKSFREALEIELKKITNRMDTMGYVFLVSAFVMNVPWIVLLALASANLEYDPGQDQYTA